MRDRGRLRQSLAPVPDPPVPLVDPARPLLTWLLAGDARCTVVSARTGNHFTVKVKQTRQPHEHAWSWFMWGRGGNVQDPDGVSDDRSEWAGGPWFYIGQLYATREYVQVVPTTSTGPRGSAALRPVNWVLRKVHDGWDGAVTAGVPARLLKSVQCARCRRPLLDPVSITRGLGPECAERLGGTR